MHETLQNVTVSEINFQQSLVALAASCAADSDDDVGASSGKKGHPIRVVRSYKLGKNNEYAPKVGYRYNGIYKIIKYVGRIQDISRLYNTEVPI